MRELFADFPYQGDFLVCLGHNVIHTRFLYTLIKGIKCSHQKWFPTVLKSTNLFQFNVFQKVMDIRFVLGVLTQLCNIESHVPRQMHWVSRFTFNINTAPYEYVNIWLSRITCHWCTARITGRNNTGPRIEPWGTPEVMLNQLQADKHPSITIL